MCDCDPFSPIPYKFKLLQKTVNPLVRKYKYRRHARPVAITHTHLLQSILGTVLWRLKVNRCIKYTDKNCMCWKVVNTIVHTYVLNTLRTGHLNCFKRTFPGFNQCKSTFIFVSWRIYKKFANCFCELKFSGNTHHRP
jgi:hypothetical protein